MEGDKVEGLFLLEPELVLQAGSYHLYIGSGITESTLATVLRVIGNA